MMRLTFTIAVALLCSMAAAASEPITCDSPCECHNANGKGRWAVKTDSSLPPTDASVIQNRWKGENIAVSLSTRFHR